MNSQVTLESTVGLEEAIQKGMDVALSRLGAKIVSQAADQAPVDTGRLKASIKVTPDLDEPVGRAEIAVGSDVYYAIYQEFGTSSVPASPYLRPAIESVLSGGDVKGVIARYNSDEIRDAIRNKRKERL